MNKLLLLTIFSALLFISCSDSDDDVVEIPVYSNPETFGTAFILRDKETKETSLNIETSGKWSLYAGTSVDNINLSKPILEGEGTGSFPISVSNFVRSYFQLVTPESKVILSETHLPMTGGHNYRDLGGIKTTDGRYLKWGKLFRSDDLSRLTDPDLQYLSSIPLTSVIDFRSKSEIEAEADKLPSSVVNHYEYSISFGTLNVSSIESFTSMTPEELNQYMIEMNLRLVTDSACIEQYKKFFVSLQDETKIPLMYHCSAGKDRTGMATALILYALGVDEKTILEDYLLSNVYLGFKYAPYLSKYPNLENVFIVKLEYLDAGLKQIKQDHGTVENYLTKVLDVDINKMRQLYLY